MKPLASLLPLGSLSPPSSASPPAPRSNPGLFSHSEVSNLVGKGGRTSFGWCGPETAPSSHRGSHSISYCSGQIPTLGEVALTAFLGSKMAAHLVYFRSASSLAANLGDRMKWEGCSTAGIVSPAFRPFKFVFLGPRIITPRAHLPPYLLSCPQSLLLDKSSYILEAPWLIECLQLPRSKCSSNPTSFTVLRA